MKPLGARSTVSVKNIPLKAIPLQTVKGTRESVPPSPDSAAEISNLPKKRPGSLALKTVSSPEGMLNNMKIEFDDNQKRPVRPTTLTNRPSSLAGSSDSKETSILIGNPTRVDSELEGRKLIAQQALPPVARPTSLSGGLPITPLMAKLSHLAMDRYGHIGTPLGDPTPCEPKDMTFPNRGGFY